ncbi:hypothetical protein [Metapseudomonas resinovorans]|uniref:hypothetical protein n=1 Tax=Metapseudomonas resinovorans TaxID=53412 RepID=UPI00040BE3CD|nr:hypothetical protein [Pseudomonas resinovorans]
MDMKNVPALKIDRLDSLTINFFSESSRGEFIEGAEINTISGIMPPLGEYWSGEGGHNAGLVRGENGAPDYYLIVPAGSEAESTLAYGGYGHETEGAGSASDGLANTRALLADSEDHPAAKLASEFTADGHRDFYLPARRELQLAEANVPELFSKAYHWSSTQFSSTSAYYVDFEDGWQGCCGKDCERLVRPVRRKFL